MGVARKIGSSRVDRITKKGEVEEVRQTAAADVFATMAAAGTFSAMSLGLAEAADESARRQARFRVRRQRGVVGRSHGVG